MKTYRVFKHEEKGYSAIKEGFSWPAFFITGIWALINMLWVHAIVLFILVFVLSISSKVLFPSMHFHVSALLGSGVSLFFGMAGNEWRSDKRKKDGYKLIGKIEADSEDNAVIKYREKIGDVSPIHYAELPNEIEITPDGTYCVEGRIFSQKEAAIRYYKEKEK